MRLWIRECTNTHQICSIPNKDHFFPLRIIDVGRCVSGNAGSDRVFIISKGSDSTPDTSRSYAALSYSWGGEANFKSTVKYIASYETDGIPIKDLPQTLQDAIMCTQEIGLRYLWVDALCIIQDDPLDKREQIPQIRNTFHFATVTLVGSRSKTVYDGFLGKPKSSGRRSGPLPYYSPSFTKAGAFHLVHTYVHEYSEDPVNQRAWTLEEALLSPRLLIYSACGLQWNCQQVNDVACQGAGSHISFGPRSAQYRLPPFIFSGATVSPVDMVNSESIPLREELESAEISWAICLRRYTSRELTRQSDKLQALSGLAEQYAIYFSKLLAIQADSTQRGPYVYLAGLWNHQMPQALTWHRDIETESSPRPQIYRGPSWSWASIDGMIHTTYVGEAFDFEIIQIHVSFHIPDYSFGRVTEGCRIEVFGLLKEVKWDTVSESLRPFEGGNDLEQPEIVIYWDAAGELGMQLFWVPVQRFKRDQVNGSVAELSILGWRYQGLLLLKVDHSVIQHCYRRVGCFHWRSKSCVLGPWEQVNKSRFSII